MILRKGVSPNVVLRFGLVFLLAVNVGHWLLQRHPSPAPDLTDGILGVLFGIAIGAILLAVWMRRRRSEIG